jgi:NAD+ diphosphatase
MPLRRKGGNMSNLPHLPMAQAAVDRDYLARENPELFDVLWSDPATRVLALYDGRVLLGEGAGSGGQASLRLLPVEDVPSAQLRVYLGKTLEESTFEPAGTPVVLAVLSTNSANQLEPNPGNWHEIRRTGFGLSGRDANLYAMANALANFHNNHKHCPSCGLPTVIEKGGWSRRCFADGKQVFPRTDPAIIVAVTDDQDRILLGSQGVWEENRWSVLAGFVEAGESLAAAVVREVSEEAGVLVDHVEYLGSQAWPFPYSLMVGFSAKLDASVPNQALVPDGLEIEKLKWFSRDEITELVAAKQIILPGPLSIARGLIEHWYGGPLNV